MNPTLLLAVGELAAGSAALLRKETLPRLLIKSLSGRSAKPGKPVSDGDVWPEIAQAVKSLLRNSAASEPEHETVRGRLDLIVLADESEVRAERLVSVLDGLSRLLAEQFAVIFPPNLQPEQRAVGLVVLLATPPLDGSKTAQTAFSTLRAIENWHLSPPASPILNRIYLFPSQTEAMPLSRQDLMQAMASFVLAAYGSGLRDSDAMRQRLGPPRKSSALVSGASVAALDADVEKLHEAFAWRSAIWGVAKLLEEAEKPPARERLLALAAELESEHFFEPLRALSDHPDAAADGLGGQRWLAALDRSESEALRQFLAQVQRLLDEHLSGNEGLRDVPLLQGALQAAEERLRQQAQQFIEALSLRLVDEKEAVPADPPPGQAAQTSIPGPRLPYPGTWATAVCAGVGCFAVVSSALLAVLARQVAAQGLSGPRVSGPASVDPYPLVVGAVCAVAVFALCMYWFWPAKAATPVGPSAQQLAQQEKKRQRTERVLADLRVRQLRVLRGACAHLDDLSQRISAVRFAVLTASARAEETFRALGGKLSVAGGPEEFSGLFRFDSDSVLVLMRSLLQADELPGLWEKSRELRDHEIFAHELLRKAWPTDWQTGDLPFSPGGAWETALFEQHQLLRQTGAFSWPDLGPRLIATVRQFLQTAPNALALGLRSSLATPLHLPEAHELLLLLPANGRAGVEPNLRELLGVTLLPTWASLSRVLLVRTSGEIELSNLEQTPP